MLTDMHKLLCFKIIYTSSFHATVATKLLCCRLNIATNVHGPNIHSLIILRSFVACLYWVCENDFIRYVDGTTETQMQNLHTFCTNILKSYFHFTNRFCKQA
jgi:hypothetical protein